MRFFQTALADAKVIEVEPRCDNRGLFARTWCSKEFRQAGVEIDVVQANISISDKRGTIRGLHFQRAPYAEPKIIRCLRGAVREVMVDLRPWSRTYCQHITIDLAEPGLSMVYVPPGFAQGIQTLVDDAIIEYLMGEYYQPDVYDGVRHDDPAFQIAWPLPIAEISDQDRCWPDWDPRATAKTGQRRALENEDDVVDSRQAFGLTGSAEVLDASAVLVTA